jgi:hypothetical protein
MFDCSQASENSSNDRESQCHTRPSQHVRNEIRPDRLLILRRRKKWRIHWSVLLERSGLVTIVVRNCEGSDRGGAMLPRIPYDGTTWLGKQHC